MDALESEDPFGGGNSDVMESVMWERARFDKKFKVEGGASQKNEEEEEVDEEWLKNAVKADKIKVKNSISQADLATQELLDDGQGTYGFVDGGSSGVERGHVATPQVSLPVPHTCVPAQTGGTANGSLVDEKEKSDHRSAHPTNRAVTSQPTAMHNRSTELLQAELSCQKADQPCCYKPTNRAILKSGLSPAPYQVRDTTDAVTSRPRVLYNFQMINRYNRVARMMCVRRKEGRGNKVAVKS